MQTFLHGQFLVMLVFLIQACQVFGDVAEPVLMQGSGSLSDRKEKLKELLDDLSIKVKNQSLELNYPNLSSELAGQDVVTVMRKSSIQANFSELGDQQKEDTQYLDSAVVAGTEYTYKISVFLEGDTGSIDSPAIQGLLPIAGAPLKPINLSCSAGSGVTSIAFDDASTNETAFVIYVERNDREDHGWSGWNYVSAETIVSTSTSSTGQRFQKNIDRVTGGGTKYRFRVKSKSDAAYSDYTGYCS